MELDGGHDPPPPLTLAPKDPVRDNTDCGEDSTCKSDAEIESGGDDDAGREH